MFEAELLRIFMPRCPVIPLPAGLAVLVVHVVVDVHLRPGGACGLRLGTVCRRSLRTGSRRAVLVGVLPELVPGWTFGVVVKFHLPVPLVIFEDVVVDFDPMSIWMLRPPWPHFVSLPVVVHCVLELLSCWHWVES